MKFTMSGLQPVMVSATNDGGTDGTTITFMEIESAHWFGFGVKSNVKVPGSELSIVGGFHVPTITGLLLETKGNTGGISP